MLPRTVATVNDPLPDITEQIIPSPNIKSGRPFDTRGCFARGALSADEGRAGVTAVTGLGAGLQQTFMEKQVKPTLDCRTLIA